jgi:amidase
MNAPPRARVRYGDADVAQLQAQMAAGGLTSRTLTVGYLRRIRRFDQRGPAINSVIELNPDALAIAAALDDERVRSGPRGPLHGVPVLLKDNIATGDRMATTAGSLALDGVTATRDAHLVTRLRDAGAVIIGKTNLSEWANIRSTRSTSGWSARGGLTRNPHDLTRNTSGSSSGSAAAIAAGFAAVSVGTETDGSIVSPASINGIVGLKPTVGLVSRDGVIPISHTQDTAGPMARSVADAALLLAAIGGVDPRDGATAHARQPDLAGVLDAGALVGARLGVVRSQLGVHPGVDEVIARALKALAEAGATLVDPVELRHGNDLWDAELEVLLHEFRAGLPAWLSEFAPSAPVATLADVIDWNERHRADEMPWFGQELFEQAQQRGMLTDGVYLDALRSCGTKAREEGIDATLAEHDLDALIAPTGGPAWLTDLVNGDSVVGGSFSSPAAVAGYPHLTVPAGHVHGLPIGLSFVGPAWSEARLLALGGAFERATHARRAPTFATGH